MISAALRGSTDFHRLFISVRVTVTVIESPFIRDHVDNIR